MLRRERWEACEASLKSGAYDNELSRFRYDVVIAISGKRRVASPVKSITWDQDGRWRDIVEQTLSRDPGKSVAICGIPDARVAQAIKAAALMEEYADRNQPVDRVTRRMFRRPPDDPDSIMRFAKRLGARLYSDGFSSDGIYRAVLNPQWCIAEPSRDKPFPSTGTMRTFPSSLEQAD